jgi:hypothetical protein
MSLFISKSLRKKVKERAAYRCEYCLVHEDDMFFSFHMEHIISVKHGGKSVLENLANACSICNENKGTDLGTYISNSKRLIRLFNPRIDKWNNHFDINDGEISAKTKRGEATINVLDLNHPDRIILRRLLIMSGRYP